MQGRDAVMGLTEGRGAEVVLDFVGIDASIAAGLGSLRKAGSLAAPWFHALPKEAEIFSFQGGTIADAIDVIALAAAGLIRNEVELLPLSRVDEAYHTLTKANCAVVR